ncbi:D-glycero-beta-D-manno-heptose-7-phosphate kinase [candidate division KSB1 bacterium]|nr:MAG: D-glycero-beta-D-manno-heptose-7-phosphate kinase [candidate division KSB1 bacterium]
MNHISADRAREIIKAAGQKHIAVLGDFMLDRHLKGSVKRISPEAPVPVVEVENETTGLGGAGNVVQNLAGLGVLPVAFGIVGRDGAGQEMMGHLESVGAITRGMLILPDRRTTEKMRIIAQDQHVVRADRETVADIAHEDEDRLLQRIESAMPSLRGLILQDYNKGVLTNRVISESLRLAAVHHVPVAVDPKFDHFFEYKRCHLFKPNVRELGRALGTRTDGTERLIQAGRMLFDRMEPDLLLVTRGEMGMTLFLDRETVEHIPTQAMKVHDVSGAGDTVIATYVVAEAGGAAPVEAAVMANYAAGIVCGEVGVVPIDGNRLLEVISERS